jgi:hypothetical protein
MPMPCRSQKTLMAWKYNMTKEQELKKRIGCQAKLYDNVSYKLVDAKGNAKKMFQMNGLGQTILRFFRKFVSQPVGGNGQVKSGILNHLAAYGLRLPGICGFWTGELNVANLMTNAGFAALAARMSGAAADGVFDTIGVGIGTTAAAAANTTLETEITDSGLAKAAGTVSRVTTTETNDTNQVTKTFTVTGTKAVTESGLLNATPTLLCRQVFAAINVVNGDNLQITWKIKCA